MRSTAIIALLGLAGASIGVVGRIRSDATEAQRREAEDAAWKAQEREGRPITLAVQQCADQVLALRLPSDGPGAKPNFAPARH